MHRVGSITLRTNQLALVLFSSGEAATLRYLVSVDRLVLHLFVNDFEPSKRAAVDDFVEPQGFGYAPIVIDESEWQIEEPTDSENPTVARYSKVFELRGPVGKVYGYFLTREIAGDAICGERFSDGPTVIGPYDTSLTVKAQLSQNGIQ